jgi:hypothetical protein
VYALAELLCPRTARVLALGRTPQALAHEPPGAAPRELFTILWRPAATSREARPGDVLEIARPHRDGFRFLLPPARLPGEP